MARRVSIIGCGAVGRTLARALADAGYAIAGLAGRGLASPRAAREFAGAGEVFEDPAEAARAADIVFITTPDAAIRTVCEGIARQGGFREGQVVLHCSGALGSDALASAADAGAHVGALHPMQTFARPAEAVGALPGTVYTVEGGKAAGAVAQEIVDALGGRLYRIDADAKALYHAASVLASNGLVALEQVACDVLAGSGIPREDALAALIPLIRGTVANLDRVGLPDALTGPVARGDIDTVRGHLAALRAFDPALTPLYARLSLHALTLARAQGTLPNDHADRLRHLLQSALHPGDDEGK